MSSTPENSFPDETGGAAEALAQPNADSRRARIGDFELRREIGRGGMGTVYEAWQLSLKRTVALKVLGNQVSASSTAVARFQREAQAAAKLHHSHIVPIFAQGEEDGVYYYAMELVDGTGLNAIIAKVRTRETADTAVSDLEETVALSREPAGREPSDEQDPRSEQDPGACEGMDSSITLTPCEDICSSTEHFRAVAEHIATVADALDYAHKQGVIHRDIKPHNLILGKDGRMRISDFGLARLSEQPGVTATGELIGSPLYMSPEQITERPANIDARTDVYSLGATMYEWLTLTPPYPGETRERVISLMLTSEPRPLRACNAKIPVDLETICLTAMGRHRDQRYQTAGELRDDLRRFLANHTITARRAGPITRTRKFIGRHQLATLGAAAAVIALILGWALVHKQSQVETQTAAAEEAIEQQDRILDLLSSVLPPEIGVLVPFAEAAVPMAQDIMATGQGMAWSPGMADAGGASAALAGTPAGIAQRAARDFYQALRLSTSLQPATGSVDEGSALLQEAVDLSENDPEAALERVDGYLTLRRDDLLAWQLRLALQGELGQLEEMAEGAERLIGLRPRDATAHIWFGLAHLLLDHGEQSLGSLTDAVQLDAGSVWAGTLRGLALVRVGRAEEALVDFESALAKTPDFVVALLGQAAAHAAIGDLVSAVAGITRVIELEPGNVDALAIRGQYYLTGGDYSAAITDFEQAMNIAGRTPALVLKYLLALSQEHQLTGAQAAEPAAQTGTDTKAELEPPKAQVDPADGTSSLTIHDWLAWVVVSVDACLESAFTDV